MRNFIIGIIVALAVSWGSALGATTPPPLRHAYPANNSGHITRAQMWLYARGCVQVAPHQWVCPMPAPRHR